MADSSVQTPSDNGQRALAEALSEVSAALNSTLELDDVLDLILDRVARVVPFSSGTIMMLDGVHAEIVRAKGFEAQLVGLRLPLDNVPNLHRVMTTGAPSLLNDTLSSPDWTVVPETEHIRSDMTVPIRADGQVVGAISVDSDQKDAFTPELLSRLEAFADQAGSAVRNASLYRQSQEALTEVREQRRLTQILADITAELMAQRDVDALLDFILDRVSSFVAGAAVTVMLIRHGVAEVVRATPGEQVLVGETLVVSETPNLRRVLETGRPHLIGDTLTDSEWASTEEISWIRSNLNIPILLAGEIIGFLTLSSREPDAFPAALFHPLETFSSQVGMAIHNARLFDEAESARRAEYDQRTVAEALGQVSAALTSTLELEQVLDLILDQLARVVPFTRGTIMLHAGEHAEVVRAKGFDTPILGLRLSLNEVPNLAKVVKGVPSLINDTASSPEWEVTEGTEDIRSNMTAPIRAAGQVVGAIGVDSEQKDAFTVEELKRLEAFADQAGSAIRNARLYQESESARAAEREERLLAEALGEVSAALSNTLELDELLDLILDRADRVMPYEAGTVLLVKGDHAEVMRARGYGDTMLGVRVPLTRLTRHVMDTGELVVIEDTSKSPDWIVTDEGKDIRSAAVVGIRSDGQVVGFISLDSRQPGSFTRERAVRLQAFADQAGNAIRNARLYQESRVARHESDQLLRAILPDQIAKELKANQRVRPRRHEDVAVLFADIVGFTQYCDTHDPEDVMEALTEITHIFEEIAERHGLEKLKTIGDSFMAAAGLLSPALNPDLQCVKAGLDMVDASRELGSGWKVRGGVHSGELIAGVLGSKKFLFDVWGDTVNTASRIESNGVTDGVSVSRASWDRVSQACYGSSRGKVAVKGKGEMEMFLIEGLR